jgi:hypothetical protein
MENYHTAAGMESVFLGSVHEPLDFGQGAGAGIGVPCSFFERCLT